MVERLSSVSDSLLAEIRVLSVKHLALEKRCSRLETAAILSGSPGTSGDFMADGGGWRMNGGTMS